MTDIITIETAAKKTSTNTKRGNYKDAVNWVSDNFGLVTNLNDLNTNLLLMVADLFERPIEKVMTDVASVLIKS